MFSVTHSIGNTKIIVHSPTGIIQKSKQEQQEYFSKKQLEGDPIICQIAERVTELLAKRGA